MMCRCVLIFAIAVVCSTTSSIGQEFPPKTLSKTTILHENDTHLIISWKEPDDKPSFNYFYINYNQILYDHSGSSQYVSSSDSNLALDGGTYSYPLSKQRILHSRYLGPLLVYVYGYEGSNRRYSTALVYNKTSPEQTSASFQLTLHLPSGVNCILFSERIWISLIHTELTAVLRSETLSFQQDGSLEVSYGCHGDSILVRGAIFVVDGSADGYRDTLRMWANAEKRYLTLNGARYSVQELSFGLEPAALESIDCSEMTKTDNVTAALVIGSVSLGLVVVLLTVTITSLVFCCYQSRKESKSDKKPGSYNLKQPQVASSNPADFSLTRNPSYGDTSIVARPPPPAQPPPTQRPSAPPPPVVKVEQTNDSEVYMEMDN